MKQITVQCEARLPQPGKIQLSIVGTLFSKKDVQIDRIAQSSGQPLAVSQFSPHQINKFIKLLREEAMKF